MIVSNDFNDPRGSVWRKWELHVHTPDTKLNDNYKTDIGVDKWDHFIDIIENSDVEVFGLTDYFSAANYFVFRDKYSTKYPESKKSFFLNIELRLNESVNKEQEEVNVHLLFNPTSIDKVDKFLNKLKVVKTGEDETPIVCSELSTEDEFKSATVTRENVITAFEQTFGKKAIRQDHFLIITAANNDGIRPMRGIMRKEVITDEIDKFTDAFFGGVQNVDHFLKTNRLENNEYLIGKKPVVSGCDAHAFEELNEYLGKRITEGKDNEECILKDVTWIKADKTFEGLRQILYEPEPGERVKIGPLKPDIKDDYKVIQKIRFEDTDFPEEVTLNSNLCSIIGSRSSGKSALLAYIAHAVDKELSEKLVKGPGEGSAYYWNKIDLPHTVVWANGKSNDDSHGKIVYIPQNHLFLKSKDPNEIKEKIEPVLFMHLPNFKAQYLKTVSLIDTQNEAISNEVTNWFNLSNAIKTSIEALKSFGDKNSIEKEIEQTDLKINQLKVKFQLSDEDIAQYQKISSEIAKLQNRIEEIDNELIQLGDVSGEQSFFNVVKISLLPALDSLPSKLQEQIASILTNEEERILNDVNEKVVQYKTSIEGEKQTANSNIESIRKTNTSLIEKYQKNIELEALVKKLNEHNQTIGAIETLETKIDNRKIKKNSCEKNIKLTLDQRKLLIEELKTSIDLSDQSMLGGIKFGVEFEIGDNIEEIIQILNTKENTQFVTGNDFQLDNMREKPGDFLDAIYSGKQKIIAHNDPKDVAQRSLSLTEKILFTAEMERDKIGGFSEPTMTPGKRALFALRLILAESNDTWPLLIDQPEDDLDSRSIYVEVVPFLKDKKKERQIIMVTHNANLVVGADSEQIIVANRNGDDRQNEDGKQFNYLTGSIEFSYPKVENCVDTLTSQGVREHACDILDGGKTAFELRRNKYNLTKA